MKIGMRNIKTALSVCICLIIAKFLKLEYPFYSMIAAIISMQNTVNSSAKVGKNRVLGTFVGAVAGLICSLIMPGSIVLSFIGIVILIYICNLLKWKQSVSIAGIVFCAIMVNMKGTSPFVYSIDRIIDTCLGIGVALLVNNFVCPPQKFNTMCKDYNVIEDSIIEHFNLKILKNKNYDVKKLMKEVNEVEKKVKIYEEEFSFKRKNHAEIDKFIKKIETLKEILIHMEVLNVFENKFILNDENKKHFTFICGDDKQDKLEMDDNYIIYNYHITEVIRKITNIIDNKNLEVIKDSEKKLVGSTLNKEIVE